MLSAVATNEYSWCMFLIFHVQVEQILSDEVVETVIFKPKSLHSFARTTLMIPLWFNTNFWLRCYVLSLCIEFKTTTTKATGIFDRMRKRFSSRLYFFFRVTSTTTDITPVCCCEEARIFWGNLTLGCQQTVKLYISGEIELDYLIPAVWGWSETISEIWAGSLCRTWATQNVRLLPGYNYLWKCQLC